MRIGVFDSGLGGLSVLNQLLSQKPQHHYFYLADNMNVPYGTKSVSEINRLTDHILRFFNGMKMDLIVVACNTIGSNADSLLNKPFPLLNIAYFNAEILQKKAKPKILFATQATLRSPLFQNVLSTGDLAIDGSLLVPLIENQKPSEEILETLKRLHSPLQEPTEVVLGCTHFPLIEREFKTLYPLYQFHEGSDLLAKQIPIGNDSTQVHFFVTAEATAYWKVINHYLKGPIHSYRKVVI